MQRKTIIRVGMHQLIVRLEARFPGYATRKQWWKTDPGILIRMYVLKKGLPHPDTTAEKWQERWLIDFAKLKRPPLYARYAASRQKHREENARARRRKVLQRKGPDTSGEDGGALLRIGEMR